MRRLHCDRWRVGGFLGVLAVTTTGGCGGDATMELAASDAIDAVADQMTVTVEEYHREVVAADADREAAVIAAFVRRVQHDHADTSAVDQHVDAFGQALGRLRQDRETVWQRREAAKANIQTLREIGGGLRTLALESLNLDDEMRRYITGWIETRRQGSAIPTAGGGSDER